MSKYEKVNKFLKDHGYEVNKEWEYLPVGDGVVLLMNIVVDIMEKFEKEQRLRPL